jgi:heat shock protein HslJ
LETELGVKLLERHARGVSPTAAGKTLKEFALEGLDAIEVGLRRVRTLAEGETDTLTITQSDEGTMTFVVGATASPSPAASAGASAAAATAKPTAAPTARPTAAPTARPTAAPTAKPGATAAPTAAPTPVPTPAPGLIGKAWQLTAITTKNPAFQGVVPPDQQANYTVEFVAGGTFAAKADCNTANGTYTTADPTSASGNLTITPTTSTTAACGDASFSDLYLLALSNAASYAIVNGELTITLLDQGTLVYK